MPLDGQNITSAHSSTATTMHICHLCRILYDHATTSLADFKTHMTTVHNYTDA